MKRTILGSVLTAALAFSMGTAAIAGGLLEKANSGEAVRIGFANEVPWAYPGDDSKPLGFVNAIALGVLDEMSIANI